MRWAVVGSKGLLGADLVELLTAMGEKVRGFHRGNIDLSTAGTSQIAMLGSFDVVVNCAAYTNVDMAESETEIAHEENVKLPLRIASALNPKETRFIHISTDYVFDGIKSTPYGPFDTPNPINVYGLTKREAEVRLLENFDNTQIVRTTWLYGKHGICFPKTLQLLGYKTNEIRVVDDQFGSPTSAEDVAKFIYHLNIEGNHQRIVHASSSGFTSWFKFAEFIVRDINWMGRLIPTSSEEFNQPAKRPKQSVLEPTNLRTFQIPNWLEAWQKSGPRVLGS